jgi:hypothetical protein
MTIRAIKLLARQEKIPRPLKWLALVGLAPVPGPFDEAVLLLVGGLLWAFYRDRMREAWRAAEGAPGPAAHDEPRRGRGD